LKSAAVMAIAPVSLIGSGATAAVLPFSNAREGAVTHAAAGTSMAANPTLVEAHARLKAALAEQREAKDALEWLADEWRHLWPLAPEELLGVANADIYSDLAQKKAERDIIGTFIRRDTSDLTTRLTVKMRRESPRLCFAIVTSDEAQKTVDAWTAREPEGRTEKALIRSRARREKCIREYAQKVALAREYEAETERLRQAAGVTKAQDRILEANSQVSAACFEILRIPAANLKDLAIKGEAIVMDDLVIAVASQNGILGQMARFIKDTVDFSGGALS